MREPEILPQPLRIKPTTLDPESLTRRRFLRAYVLLALSAVLLTANFFGPTYFQAPEDTWRTRYGSFMRYQTLAARIRNMQEEVWHTYRIPLATIAFGGWCAQLGLIAVWTCCYRTQSEIAARANACKKFFSLTEFLRIGSGFAFATVWIASFLSGLAHSQGSPWFALNPPASLRCCGLFSLSLLGLSVLSYMMRDRLIVIEAPQMRSFLARPQQQKQSQSMSIAQIVILTTVVAIFLNVERNAAATLINPTKIISDLQSAISPHQLLSRQRWEEAVMMSTAAILCTTLTFTTASLVMRIGKRGFAILLSTTLLVAAGPANLAVWKAFADRDRPALESLFHAGCFLYGLLLVSWAICFILSCVGFRMVDIRQTPKPET